MNGLAKPEKNQFDLSDKKHWLRAATQRSDSVKSLKYGLPMLQSTTFYETIQWRQTNFLLHIKGSERPFPPPLFFYSSFPTSAYPITHCLVCNKVLCLEILIGYPVNFCFVLFFLLYWFSAGLTIWLSSERGQGSANTSTKQARRNELLRDKEWIEGRVQLQWARALTSALFLSNCIWHGTWRSQGWLSIYVFGYSKHSTKKSDTQENAPCQGCG